ncbi:MULTISPECIES: hypothetical protein [Providencia]|uniref:hypothetical protein n=1 Tax=Providencia TaxID=586 RepID=UPI0004525EE7|nr:hypothetical protein [Providencia alcalifaciens]ETT07173.1 hypothetical protein HMPREF1562_3348 [Providencia alcalifaciens F90-2004]QNP20609.1 hypothetical protein H9L31_01570 [Providencia rettgeri]
MTNVLPLEAVAYKARQVSSLYSVILELADKECSCELLDLISIASDLNDEMWQALKSSVEEAS